MRKVFVFLMGLFLVFFVAGAVGAVPVELITNGDFENDSNHSLGWNSTGSVDFTQDFGVLAKAQGLNGYYARLGLDTTNSDSSLSQSFTVSGIDEIAVSFDWAFDFWDNSFDAQDNFISLLASDGSTAFTITMLDLKTNGSFWNIDTDFAYGSFSYVYDISSYTVDNANVEFKLHEESDSDLLTGTASVVGIDNVSITGEPVPEPATMVLLGLGLVGLAGITRKKFGR